MTGSGSPQPGARYGLCRRGTPGRRRPRVARRGLGTCMVCGTHGSTQSTGDRGSVQPVSRAKPAASRPRVPSRPEGPLGSGRRPRPPGTWLAYPRYRSLDALSRLLSCMSPDRSPCSRGRTARAAPPAEPRTPWNRAGPKGSSVCQSGLQTSTCTARSLLDDGPNVHGAVGRGQRWLGYRVGRSASPSATHGGATTTMVVAATLRADDLASLGGYGYRHGAQVLLEPVAGAAAGRIEGLS
jgi:hypothetical protein